MCGIAGAYNFNCKSISERLINDMIQPLHFRGPDSRGVWCHNNLGLGHTRLSVIDLSDRGRQPMSNDGRYWIIFNGEKRHIAIIAKEIVLLILKIEE